MFGNGHLTGEWETHAWTKERFERGEKITYQALRSGYTLAGNGVNDRNDYVVSDMSYVRLKNLEIGFSLPQKWMKRMGIGGIRLAVSGQNLWSTNNMKAHSFDPRAGQREPVSADAQYQFFRTAQTLKPQNLSDYENHTIYRCCVAGGFRGSGCSLLDTTPDGRETLDQIFADHDKTAAYLNTCYSKLPTKGTSYYWVCNAPTALSDEGYLVSGTINDAIPAKM